MLRLGDDLVVDMINVALDRDILRLSRNGIAVGTCRRTSLFSGCSCLQRLQSHYWADRRIVAEPRVLAYLVQLHPLRRIRLEQPRDQVFCNMRESSRPLDSLVQNIVEKLFLILAHERRISRQQFKKKHAEVPNVQRLVVATLANHLGGQVLRCTAIGHSLPVLVEEV